ncbi:MAG: hypothetical protein KF778_18275 [Rhodocyclaceae bacterium]|nr:hypothetical protein [Rhodocyclaceae bacterium]MBX3670352.1 hypothetical protein [Rhodocyclaceae bacterium]
MSTTPTPALRHFLTLYAATGRQFAATLLLWGLVEAGAERDWVSLTLRDLVRLLQGNLSLGAVSANIKRLEQAGLLESRFDSYPPRRSYRIKPSALCPQDAVARSRAKDAQALEDTR